MAAVFIQQFEKKTGVQPTTEQQAYRHIAEEVTFQGAPVDRQQFFPGLLVRRHRRKRFRFELIPALNFYTSRICYQHRSRSKLVDSSIDRVRRGSEPIA